MSRQSDRDEFIALMSKEGVDLATIKATMRDGATLQRLAEAQCNGDYPADNGERKVKQCPRCEQGWVPSFFVKDGNGGEICKECRIQERVTARLKPFNAEPIFQGDPRGAVVKIKAPSGWTNDWGKTGICVP